MISESVYYIGVNDRKIDLFENQYVVPEGVSYNSYIIKDSKCAVVDTVDVNFSHQWISNIKSVLGDKAPDYLIVHHMEPDHSANIDLFLRLYPDAKVVTGKKAVPMINNFFGIDLSDKCITVDDGDTLDLGEHKLTFYTAPMVHWPEVVVSYDSKDGILFSADAFGKFGDLNAKDNWVDEARRYYIGIVGKYGVQVQALLKKLASLDVKKICPLHGPALDENLGYYINLYDIWSSYKPEEDGVLIAYVSMYGNTKKAAELLYSKLQKEGLNSVELLDLARCDIAKATALAFRYSTTVFATPTYNGDIFPFMKNFINHLTERNFQNRTVAFIENGSWAAQATKVMKKMLESCKNLTFAESGVSIRSGLKEENIVQIEALKNELIKDKVKETEENESRTDSKALFNIGYGLYAVTCNDKIKDNGLILNTVSQVTSSPCKIAVTINKQNYSHDVILKSKILNICCLSKNAPYSIFETLGFASGKDKDKMADIKTERSENGLVYLTEYSNSFISLKVDNTVDVGTHTMFICSVTEAKVLSSEDTMTYTYYHSSVKPKPKSEGKKGYVCKICGWIYYGDTLPDDIECPICYHGKDDFEPLE